MTQGGAHRFSLRGRPKEPPIPGQMRTILRVVALSACSTVFATFVLGAVGCSSDEPTAAGAQAEGESSTTSDQVGWSCPGSYSKKKATDGAYYATSFGCYTSEAGKLMKDPGDNCLPGCQKIIGSALCPNAKTGPTCEAEIKWFAADAGRFGCGQRLKVTNPKNGKSLVVAAIDYGPSCKVESKVKHAALDLSYPSTWYLFQGQQGIVNRATVTVEEVGASTPLGPVKANPDAIVAEDAVDPPADEGDGTAENGPDVAVDADGEPLVSTEPPVPLGCEALGEAGVCEGNTLHYCEAGVILTVPCSEIGGTCGPDPDLAGYSSCL